MQQRRYRWMRDWSGGAGGCLALLVGLLGGCTERVTISVRLVAGASCSAAAAADRGQGSAVVAQVRAMQARLQGSTPRSTRCVEVAPSSGVPELSSAFSAGLGGSLAFKDVAQEESQLLVWGGKQGCDPQGLILCGRAQLSLPPDTNPLELPVHCYDAASAGGAQPPAEFAACRAALGAGPLPDGGPDSDAAPADAGSPDAPGLDGPSLDGPEIDGPSLDGPGLDGPPADAASSDGPYTTLSCSAPALVGSSPPTALEQVAITTDGLTLWAKAGSSGGYVSATRPDVGSPFGVWSTTQSFVGKSDLDFFSYQGNQWLIATVFVNPARGFELCQWPSLSCAALPVLQAGTLTPVTADMDGASVAVTSSGLLVAHNVGPQGMASADIYLATPKDPANLAAGLVTAPVNGLVDPVVKEDDPALGPDGLVLVFARDDSGTNKGDIWYSLRATTSEPFAAPAPVGAPVNTANNERSPLLWRLPDGRYELYYSAGIGKLYRAFCALGF